VTDSGDYLLRGEREREREREREGAQKLREETGRELERPCATILLNLLGFTTTL